MGNGHSFFIYAISDATGELSMEIAFAALRQFKVDNVNIIRKARVTNQEKIISALNEAKRRHAIVLHTFVSPEIRKIFHVEAEKIGVIAVDIMGPVLKILTDFLHSTPSAEPGLKYKLTKEYFRRQEAVEFTVKHDDGLGLDTITTADIVLLGISRTCKTPLSMYLGYRGHKVANVPIVKDVPFPEQLKQIEPKKIFGLVISPSELVNLREARLIKMGRPLTEKYAKAENIEEELDYSRKIFRDLRISIIDVTSKSIEELATEILISMGL